MRACSAALAQTVADANGSGDAERQRQHKHQRAKVERYLMTSDFHNAERRYQQRHHGKQRDLEEQRQRDR